MTRHLPQVCWCDTRYRWAPVDDIRNGIGWSCDGDHHCRPGCPKGAGRRPGGFAVTPQPRRKK